MAKVNEVTVSAGRTFNHPYEDYSNLKPYVSLKVILEDGDDPVEVVKAYQARAEQLVEDHKQHMLQSLKQLHLMSQYQRKVACLETSIQQAQTELEKLRQQQTELQLQLPEPEEEGLPF